MTGIDKNWTIDQHWLTGVYHCPSPNFDERPECAIDTLVIHNISLPPGEFGGCHIDELFTNTLDPAAHPYFTEICDLEVSAHLLISRAAEVTQFVAFNKRAWHAGKSNFNGRERVNDFSIGIELEGTDDVPYEAVQYDCLAQLVRLLAYAYPLISHSGIVGHSDISPGRKSDPGPAFDWPRLHGLLDAIREKDLVQK